MALSLFTAPLVGCAVQPGDVGAHNEAALVSTTLVISQVYGGGGNATGTYKSDYVELFNLGTADASTSGLSLWAPATSTAGTFTLSSALPAVTIPAGGHYLIAEETGLGAAALPVTADYTPPVAFSIAAGNGMIALAPALTAPVATDATTYTDLVGWGGGGGSETALAGAMSVTQALVRAGTIAGCTDSGDNATDFTATTPSPLTSATASDTPCTTITPPPDMTILADMTGTDGAVSDTGDLSTANGGDAAVAIVVGDGGDPTGNQPSATNGSGPTYKPGGSIAGGDTTAGGRGFNGCSVGGNTASTPWLAGLLVAAFALVLRRRRTA